MPIWTKIGCWRYRTALEDRVGSDGVRHEANPRLDAHLYECAECRQSLDDALLATALLRDSDAIPADDSVDYATDYSTTYSTSSPNEYPEPSASSQFSMRVMASLREEISRRAAPELIWRPLELLASRFAMAAAAVLLIFSIYIAEFAPPFRPAPPATQAESSQVEPGQVESGVIMPEPPAQPTTPDEVLMSLAGEGQ